MQNCPAKTDDALQQFFNFYFWPLFSPKMLAGGGVENFFPDI
jgi:hypothetical protein